MRQHHKTRHREVMVQRQGVANPKLGHHDEEHFEAPPEDIGLGGFQPRRQPVQALLLGRAQVDLNRLRDAPRGW